MARQPALSPELARLAQRQLDDYRARTPGTFFASATLDSLDDAYAVQAEVARLRELDGEPVAGFKVGCTSESVQRTFGMRGPVSGFLFASELHESGTSLDSTGFAMLAVEAEVVVRIGDGGRAVSAHPGIELHQLVFRGDPPTLPELVANNAIHAGLVLGPAVALDALAGMRLALCVDGACIDEGPPSAFAGGVAESLAWLSVNLERVGRELAPSHVVLTGTSLGIHRVDAGQRVEARLTGGGETVTSAMST